MADADENTTTTTEEDKTTEQDDASKGDEGLGDAGKKALDAERARAKAAEQKYKDSQKSIADLTAKVKSFEDRDKSDSDKAAERIAELEKAVADKDSALAAKDLEALRSKVANRKDKQVPVSSVTGTTEEEMIASADLLLEWRKPTQTGPLRQTGPRSGAAAPPAGSNPKSEAAAAIRAMRAGN